MPKLGERRTVLLDSKITAYKGTDVNPIKSRHDIEALLETKFNITKYMWMRGDPSKAYFIFNYKSHYAKEEISYKISIPFIEKYPAGKNHKHCTEDDLIFDEARSYRFTYHIIKAMLEMQSIGMEVEQIFRDFTVIGNHVDGTPMTLGEKYDIQLMSDNLNKVPALL